MTAVKHFYVTTLPATEDLVAGGIYFLANGDQYLVKNNKEVVKVTDIHQTEELPSEGSEGKLYIAGGKIYFWQDEAFHAVDGGELPNGRMVMASEIFDPKFLDSGTFMVIEDPRSDAPFEVPYLAQIAIIDVEDLPTFKGKSFIVRELSSNTSSSKIKMQSIDGEELVDDPAWKDCSSTALVDNSTVKLVNGLVSAPLAPVQDDNITPRTTPVNFIGNHVVSNFQDNGFIALFEKLTGGSLTGLTTSFVVNTYKKNNASGILKYHQDIDVYVGDSFSDPNITARIKRVTTLPNNWGGDDRAVIEQIHRVINSPLIPIDYALVGATIYDTRTSKSYVAVRSDGSNPITNIWKESSNDKFNYSEDYSINKLPNEYPLGNTSIHLAGSSDGYTEIHDAMNTYFDWQILSGDITYSIRTNRNLKGQVLQNVDIYYTQAQAGKLFATMARVSNFAQTAFEPWRGNTVIMFGKRSPSMSEYGMNGNLYYNTANSTLYKMSTTQKMPTMIGWAAITPTVLSVTDAPIPPSGDEFVYDAESVKQMVDNHANKRATIDEPGHVLIDESTIFEDQTGRIAVNFEPIIESIDAHAIKHASETDLGHVRVDNQTIEIDEFGVISATPREYKLNRVYHEGELPESQDVVVINVPSSEHEEYEWEVYDDGLLLNPNQYTLTFDSDNEAIVFTRSIVKEFDAIIMLRGERVVSA